MSQTSSYHFPTTPYGGLLPDGWGEPPRRRKNIGRWATVVVSALVIVGGVTTAIVVLSNRSASSPGDQSATKPSDATTSPTGRPTRSGAADGNTTVALANGECANARVSTDNQQYVLTGKVACGSSESDLVVAHLSTPDAGCADHQYLRVDGPGGTVYCFTLDVKQGDCVDSSYLKMPCPSAPYTVLSTEAGPGSSDSCSNSNGATHWVPIGHDPVGVGCIGPAKSS